MKIRVAASNESDLVGELVWLLLDELAGDEPSGHSISQLQARAAKFMDSGAVTALLAFDSETPIGVLTLNECQAIHSGNYGEITELYVRPAYRSSGIGESLIEAAVSIAIERDWSRLEVGTPEQPKWHRSMQFYARQGFISGGQWMKREFG